MTSACTDPKEQEASSAEKQHHSAFTTPLAFTLPGPSGCAAGYRLVEAACVHEAAERVMGPALMQAALTSYLRGASSPRLDIGEDSPTRNVQSLEAPKPAPGAPSPAALSKAGHPDAKAAETKRLRDLQRQIDEARARAGLGPGDPSVPAAKSSTALQGVQVEVESNGVKRSMSASEWVEQQRVQQK